MGNFVSKPELSTALDKVNTQISATKAEISGISSKSFVPWSQDLTDTNGYTLKTKDDIPALTYNKSGLKVYGTIDASKGFTIAGVPFSPFAGVDYTKTNDFVLGKTTTERGETKGSRALVKENGAKLVVNYENDFTGGVDIQASGGFKVNGGDVNLNTGLNGAMFRIIGPNINLNTGAGGTVFVDKICSTVEPKRCIDLNYNGPDGGINFTNKDGGQLRFQDDANFVQYSKSGVANLAFNKLDGKYGN